MEPDALVDGIASPDPGVRRAALERLSSAGAEAVAPLITVLCDEESPVDWSLPALALRKIGDAAVDPLVEAIATAPTLEVARRAGWAFSGLEVSDVERYVPALGHPSPKVRGDAAYVLQLKGKDARPYVPDLLPLLADTDAEVRRRAIWALSAIGPGGVVPQLKRLRRKAATPALRRHALAALAEIAGPSKMDPADLALLRRLIAVKLHGDTPAPMHLCGHWWALPTTDQQAVLDAFGLASPEPVTMRLGGSVWNLDQHEHDGHGACARVYVSPAFDGWTLVFGDSSADAHTDAAVLERCADLSRRFGEAHWYGQSCGDGWNAWCLAVGGEIVRRFDNEDPTLTVGGPHPAEEGWMLTFDEDDEDERDLCFASDIAASASIDPEALGPHTSVVGHGVLVLTACGLKRGHPKGSAEI